MNFSDIFKSGFLENMASVSLLDMTVAMALAFGLICLVISAWFYGRLVPWMIRGCVNGIGSLFHRKERRA